MLDTCQHTKNGAASGMLIVTIAALFISFANVLSPLVYGDGSNAYTLLILRYSGFLMVCGCWIYVRKSAISLTASDLAKCCIAGLAYAAGSGFLLSSFSYIPVGLAVLIFFTFPLVTRCFEGILDWQAPPILELAALTLAFIGVTILLGVSTDLKNWTGLLLAILASVCISGSYVCTGRSLAHIEPALMTFIMSLAGIFFSIIFVIGSGRWQLSINTLEEWSVLLAAILSFSFAFPLMFMGIRKIGASHTAMLMNFEPLFTIGLAFLILNERLMSLQLFGAVLVITSVFVSQMAIKKATHS